MPSLLLLFNQPFLTVNDMSAADAPAKRHLQMVGRNLGQHKVTHGSEEGVYAYLVPAPLLPA